MPSNRVRVDYALKVIPKTRPRPTPAGPKTPVYTSTPAPAPVSISPPKKSDWDDYPLGKVGALVWAIFMLLVFTTVISYFVYKGTTDDSPDQTSGNKSSAAAFPTTKVPGYGTVTMYPSKKITTDNPRINENTVADTSVQFCFVNWNSSKPNVCTSSSQIVNGQYQVYTLPEGQYWISGVRSNGEKQYVDGTEWINVSAGSRFTFHCWRYTEYGSEWFICDE
ncbi:MAG TPA: hypothetical protein VLE47_00275 [Candidatus Saccharimonadales bacterium]|nr:hypothetical protein [Candidatus Saccharimonadales bacterium]